MRNYLRNWNLMRVLRLAMGIIIIGQGIASGQWMFVVLGGVFALMPLLNIGCCGPAGCAAPTPNQRTYKKVEDITFEEVK